VAACVDLHGSSSSGEGDPERSKDIAFTDWVGGFLFLIW